VILQALPGAWFFPAAFSALSAVGPLAVSFAVPLAMVLGGGVVPALIGVLGQRGAFATGIALIGGTMLLGAVLASRLDREPARGDAGADGR
jgi:NNP family nitrate/nitrite transporter-like MFS transporter